MVGIGLLVIVACCGLRIMTVSSARSIQVLISLLAICLEILVIGIRLGRFRVGNSFVWAFVIYLVIGTVPKIASLSGMLSNPDDMARNNPELAFLTYSDLAHALILVVMALGICMLLILAVPTSTPPGSEFAEQVPNLGSLRNFLVATVLIGGLAIGLAKAFHLGALGQAPVRLPFGAATIITRCESDVAPDLAILALYYAVRLQRYERSVLVLNVLLAVGRAFVTTSRGTIPLCAVSILVVYALSARQMAGSRALVRVGAIFAVGLLLFPILSSTRTHQITGVAAPSSSLSVGEILLLSLTRVQGADGILQMSHSEATIPHVGTLEAFSGSQMTLSPYYTTKIVGVTRPDDFRSPGIIGAALILGGFHWWPLALIGVIGIFLLLGRFALRRGPRVVMAAILVGFADNYNEGTMAVLPIVMFVLVLLGIGFIHERLTSPDDPAPMGLEGSVR